jgi:hypothetical protein
MGDLVYLTRGAADVAEMMEMLKKTHKEGRLQAVIMTHWTTDGEIRFTSVGDMDSGQAVMEAIGTMEHHKNFILSAYNAALIAKANQQVDEDDGRRSEDEPPSTPA